MLTSRPEIYISTDIEVDGPIPGINSMLSLGSAAYSADGVLLDTFSANLIVLPDGLPDQKTSEWWARRPKAFNETRTNLEQPANVMERYCVWLETFNERPVFVGYPASFDFMFVYWYLIRFAGHSPFGHSALDIRSYAMAVLGQPFSDTGKNSFPADWVPGKQLSHIALQDAIDQGAMFCKMLRQNSERILVGEHN